jgi:cobalt-zinc-cadmium efflux system protein
MSQPHSHALPKSATFRLGLSLGITLIFVVVEVIFGIIGNSLALLTDAAHNATDVLALALSWYAMYIATRPAHAGKTFGYHRAGILAALINAISLGVIAIGIFVEAYHRLNEPPEVNASILIGVGTLAFIVNVFTAWLVHRGSENDLNLRSAFLHLMGDVLSTAAAVVAGIAIAFTGWFLLDPLVSALIGIFILWNAVKIFRECTAILLESTPKDINVETLLAEMHAIPEVQNIHDLHIWSLNEQTRFLSAHVRIADMSISAGAKIQAALGALLERNYNIHHYTLQLECEHCPSPELYCELEPHTH